MSVSLHFWYEASSMDRDRTMDRGPSPDYVPPRAMSPLAALVGSDWGGGGNSMVETMNDYKRRLCLRHYHNVETVS